MFPETWQWVVAALAAFLIGLSKTGISGLGILSSSVFALLIPAREASGFVLPMLILGDLVAVLSYRQHAERREVLRLLPWTLPGLILGFLALGRINDSQARRLIGAVLILMTVWHLLKKLRPSSEAPSVSTALAAGLGLGAGFTTLVANAAGPIMNLYLLSMRLPKMAFVGTAAVFFCVINLVKVPFMVSLGSIHPHSLLMNLALAPFVLAGAWLGRHVLRLIPQNWFEYSALALSAVAALKLLF